MANITKVPNGPLIKKKGPFKGSTLKSGGTVKKAQGGAAMTKRDSTMADIKEQTRLRQNLTDFRKKVGDKPLTSAQIREKDSLKGLLSDYSTKKRVKATGISAEQLAKNDQKLKEKMARKPDSESGGSNASDCYKRGKSKGSCSTGETFRGQSLRDNRRNGGPVKKAQTGIYQPMNAKTKIKTRSADGNYKLKIKGDKVVERRTLKGFFKGAPKAAGRMKEVPAGLIDKLTKKETEDSPKDITKKPVVKKEVAMSKPSSFVAPIGQIPMQRKSTDTTPVRTKSVMKKGGRVVKAKSGAMIKRAQNGESFTKDGNEYTYTKQVTRPEGKRKYEGKSIDQATAMKIANFKSRNTPSDSLRTVKPVVKKNGGLIKRADGSMSRRGLWDNIRANKGSGKKPTAAMLKQEKKIKAKTKK